MSTKTPIGCYVHIPFCVRKCAYCDFNSYSGFTANLVNRYVESIISEINNSDSAPIDTIFFGGGTPTAISADLQTSILNAVFKRFAVDTSIEVTTEANPGSSDVEGLAVLRAAGFNRISFGVQSFDDSLLKSLDRIHSADEAVIAVSAAKRAGFENISIDLMFGLPNQTIVQWKDTLKKGIDLGVKHISLYNLIVEEGTGFATLAKKGRLHLPDNDIMADMYALAIEYAESAGLRQYEISNFAAPGLECNHNVHYWQNDPYFGFGAGAVSYLGGIRRTNVKSPIAYCKAVESRSVMAEERDESSTQVRMSETMMLGLRMTDRGVSISDFIDKYHLDPRSVWSDEIRQYENYGLLEVTDDRLLLTKRGLFMANDVMAAFL